VAGQGRFKAAPFANSILHFPSSQGHLRGPLAVGRVEGHAEVDPFPVALHIEKGEWRVIVMFMAISRLMNQDKRS
jgi:hypothetical protein